MEGVGKTDEAVGELIKRCESLTELNITFSKFVEDFEKINEALEKNTKLVNFSMKHSRHCLAERNSFCLPLRNQTLKKLSLDGLKCAGVKERRFPR